ncbi:rho GTPase-activating protein [Elysia marginata]|uniref:Rho GTPase-activating protein n=1 Tax=Elysia marginata TaxID=1093978 RepID=A0AAV4IXP6_9GAST|nr:rho GTPase-activating protein [Elysia marginata]
MKKSKKSPNIISNLLRKIRSPHPLVFGLPLNEICDENCDPPESIIRLMVLVYRRGPTVPGILRRGNKIALAKEIREKIDAGVRYSIEDHQAPTAASVFKEFLRCIPGGLLVHDLHDQWITVNKDDPVQVKLDKLKSIISQLSPAHLRLLKLTVSLLQHLAKHSAQTNMGPTNLATCIAPSLCPSCSGATPGPGFPHGKNSHSGFPSPGGGSNASTAAALLQVQNSMREITTVFTPLIAFMIVKHVELFGPDILTTFVKYDCEPSPSISLEEIREENSVGAGEEGIGGEGEKLASMTDSASGRHRESSMGDEVEEEDDDDDEMMGEDDDEDDVDEEDEEEEEEYGGNYGRHQAQLRRHPHSKHQDQHVNQRHGTQAPSGPRDSNSGTDSDSMHSVLSMPDTGSGMGYRRDDSSLDSLVEREYFQHEETGSGSPQAHKSHLSPSNLSRDSGLTLSDTQLYDEEAGTAIGGVPYPGDCMAGRFYQRSTSTNLELDQHQHPEGDDWLARSMVDSRTLDSRREQLHPSRLGRESKKKSRDSSEGSDGESGQGQSAFNPATFRSRPPFKHSSSSPLLDIQPTRPGGKAGGAELKPCLTHPPIGKRISSDSIGEEDEGQYDHEAYVPRHLQHHHQAGQPGSAIDFRRLRLNKDMGTIVKSNSGTHLFLSDDTLPTRYNLTRGQGKVSPLAQTHHQAGRYYLRQESMTDSTGTPTPPTSPDVKEPASSPLAKNNASLTPKPTESLRQTKPWEPEMNSAYRDWDGQLANTFSSGSLSQAFSKSITDLRAQDYGDDDVDDMEDQDKTITADNVSKLSSRPESPAQPPSPKLPPPSPKLWGGRKSHEAEEVVDMRKRPHFSLMLHPESDFTASQSQPYRKRSLGLPPQHLIKGSPPPNVILQSLSGSRKEVSQTSVPLRASYDSAILSQVRRSSADLPTQSGRDIIKSINSIRPEEYVSVTSKPIMITSCTVASSEESGSNTLQATPLSSSSSLSLSSLASPRSSLSPLSSASARRAKLAKYMGAQSDTNLSSKDQAAEIVQQRPEKPPNYHQALQRNFMIRHSVPIDITDDDTGKQRELNAKAKALYEKSLQLYNEQRINRTKEEESPRSASKDKKLGSNSLNEDSVINQDKSVIDTSVHSGRIPKDLVIRSGPQNSKKSPDYFLESPPTESGFLDLGSISDSLQTDVLSRREKHQAKTNLNTPTTSSFSVPPASSEGSSISDSLSRHDSRLSDVSGSSSGGSTITISTLGRPSDTSSGSRASMASSVASSTGGDSSVESAMKHHSTNDKDILRMNYSRHFRPQDSSEADSKTYCKDEIKERGSKELEWTSEGEGVYVSLKKNPQQLYLESKKMYEQKQIPTVSSHANLEPSSSTLSSTETNTVQSPIAHFHSQMPQALLSKSGPSLHLNTVQKSSRGHARPKSMHDMYSLHRSQSDASDSSARAVRHNPRLKATPSPQSQAVETRKIEQNTTLVAKAPVPSQPHRLEAEKLEMHQAPSLPTASSHNGPSDMPSERHQNFHKARSLFYNPEESNSHHVSKPSFKVIGGPRKSVPSTFMLSSSVSTSNLSNVKHENRFAPFPFSEDLTVESGHSPRSKSNVPIKSKASNMSASSLSLSTWQQSSPSPSLVSQPTPSKSTKQTKQELPWSVKSLKSLYDRDTKGGDKNGSHNQPPPYQNPPPFRRLQEHSRVSTSSSSSTGSEASTEPGSRKSSLHPGPLHRSGGPQAFTEGFGSFSSSEDGYSSSLDRKSQRSLDSSQEALSDHTNITYV